MYVASFIFKLSPPFSSFYLFMHAHSLSLSLARSSFRAIHWNKNMLKKSKMVLLERVMSLRR